MSSGKYNSSHYYICLWLNDVFSISKVFKFSFSLEFYNIGFSLNFLKYLKLWSLYYR